jgi:SET domain-containing protein
VAARPCRPRLVRRRSAIAGFGIFAAEPIPKGRRIIEYTGQLISQGESARREQRYLREGRIWCFNVNRRWVRDAAVGGNLARFINHACVPNCRIKIARTTIWILASRRIEKGEELTYDYWTGGAAKIRCTCRPDCGRTL